MAGTRAAQAGAAPFAARRPGALSAFSPMVHRKLSQGIITQSQQLRRVSVTTQAQQPSVLTEQRGDLVTCCDLAAAMEALVHRIATVQRVKEKSGRRRIAENCKLVVAPLAAGRLLRLLVWRAPGMPRLRVHVGESGAGQVSAALGTWAASHGLPLRPALRRAVEASAGPSLWAAQQPRRWLLERMP